MRIQCNQSRAVVASLLIALLAARGPEHAPEIVAALGSAGFKAVVVAD